jgi:hypothetical protein
VQSHAVGGENRPTAWLPYALSSAAVVLVALFAVVAGFVVFGSDDSNSPDRAAKVKQPVAVAVASLGSSLGGVVTRSDYADVARSASELEAVARAASSALAGETDDDLTDLRVMLDALWPLPRWRAAGSAGPVRRASRISSRMSRRRLYDAEATM